MPSKTQIKNFIREVRKKQDERIADSLGGGGSFATFTGATSITGGASGLVPAPETGDENKFLRGDGSWATVAGSGGNYGNFTGATSVSPGTAGLVPQPLIGAENYFLRGDGNWASIAGSEESAAYVLSDHISTIEGGFWTQEVNNAPVLRLRHGDYIYNFHYDAVTLAGATSSEVATVEANTYFLDTVPANEDGGVWYDDSERVPALRMRKGNYVFGYNCDNITWVGGNAKMTAYLPFDSSPTADALGNAWTASGSPVISAGKLSLNGSSYVTNTTISNSVGSQAWTIDFRATAESGITAASAFWGTWNDNYNTSHSSVNDNGVVALVWRNGTLDFDFYHNAASCGLSLAIGERHHYAVCYDGTTAYVFVDGSLKAIKVHNIKLGGDFLIGNAPGQSNFCGTIERFRIFKGVAIWTSDFTPPTDEDYL